MSDTNTTKQMIESLSFGHVLDQVEVVDWDEMRDPETGEGWEAWEVVECPECERPACVSSNMGRDQHRYITPEIEDENGDEIENECMHEIDGTADLMAPRFWECRIDDLEEAAHKIAHLSACVVMLADGRTGLTTTGGDEWSIFEAFVCLGYAPPFQLALDCRPNSIDHRQRKPELLAAFEAVCWAISGKVDQIREKVSMIKDR